MSGVITSVVEVDKSETQLAMSGQSHTFELVVSLRGLSRRKKIKARRLPCVTSSVDFGPSINLRILADAHSATEAMEVVSRALVERFGLVTDLEILAVADQPAELPSRAS